MILPRPITLSGPIAVHVDLYDADGQKPTSRFRWFINGNAVTGVSGPELRPDLIRRGDMVAVEVIASDGQIESMPYRTEDIEVINSPPIVTRVTIEAEGGSVPGRIHANVEAADPDHDEIQLAYRWWRNDKLIKEGADRVLDTSGFSRKDVLGVEVVARDQEKESAAVRATPIVLGNSAPEITSTPGPMSSREQYDYLVKVTDIDGDPVAFSLETAPPGMSIDRATGRITWNVTPGLSGTHRVKIIADDGQGGTTWQEFEITIPSTAQAPNQPTSQG
jgi:hypothetical protein